jgi:hypothetical protein
MSFQARRFIAATAVMAVFALSACADDPQKKSDASQVQPPAVANAAQAPAIAVPPPVSVPVPAYGPNPHPSYYYPPMGVSMMPGPMGH